MNKIFLPLTEKTKTKPLIKQQTSRRKKKHKKIKIKQSVKKRKKLSRISWKVSKTNKNWKFKILAKAWIVKKSLFMKNPLEFKKSGIVY